MERFIRFYKENVISGDMGRKRGKEKGKRRGEEKVLRGKLYQPVT
jgi:hypothetical protein